MALDPQVEVVLGLLKQRPSLRDVPVEVIRAAPMLPQTDVIPMAEVRDLQIPASPAPIPARLYRPTDRRDLPLLVYYHGGGFILGNLDTHDNICRRLAREGGFAVLAVDYRLAPEHPFPAAPDDALSAFLWAAGAGAELGVDASRIAVGGDSAGGNLAAVTSVRARDLGGAKPVAQLLVYPVTNHNETPTPSMIENGEGYFLSRDDMEYFTNLYLPEAADALHPYFSVLRTPDLGGLPPAYVITAHYDPLRDEGEIYAEQLRAAGVSVEAIRYDGMIHGFYGMNGIDMGLVAIDRSAAWLKGVFAG